MNAYDIIKNCIEEGNSDSIIIDKLQEEYPDSQIENNIFIIEETKSILENPPKPIPTEMQSSYFLIKSDKEYFDLESGRRFKEYKDKNYSQCRHGLCKKLNTLVLKNVVKKSHSPSVFYSIQEKPQENKPIRIKYQDDNKKQRVWEFTSYEINKCIEGIEEGLEKGLNDKQLNKFLSIKLFSPREAIPKLIKHIDINQKLNRSRNGSNQSKNNKRLGRRQVSRKTRRED